MRYLARLEALQKEHPALSFGNPTLIPASVRLVAPASHTNSWQHPWAERNAMLRALDIPIAWKEGLLRMSGMRPPDGVTEERWSEISYDVDYVAETWGGLAARLGWSDLHLFGCSPGLARRLDRDGLATRLHGREVVDISDTSAVLADGAGAVHRLRRRPMPEAVPLWRANQR